VHVSKKIFLFAPPTVQFYYREEEELSLFSLNFLRIPLYGSMRRIHFLILQHPAHYLARGFTTSMQPNQEEPEEAIHSFHSRKKPTKKSGISYI
jgi:hypothetical protein